VTPFHGSWAENVLNSFGNGNDGAIPTAGVIFDEAGNLYGTTSEGGKYTVGMVYGKWQVSSDDESGPSMCRSSRSWGKLLLFALGPQLRRAYHPRPGIGRGCKADAHCLPL
jgi:hypothetical protein